MGCTARKFRRKCKKGNDKSDILSAAPERIVRDIKRSFFFCVRVYESYKSYNTVFSITGPFHQMLLLSMDYFLCYRLG